MAIDGNAKYHLCDINYFGLEYFRFQFYRINVLITDLMQIKKNMVGRTIISVAAVR